MYSTLYTFIKCSTDLKHIPKEQIAKQFITEKCNEENQITALVTDPPYTNSTSFHNLPLCQQPNLHH